MPADPTPAQREASRKNGARSRGPVSAEGRARIARAATRHGLFGTFRILPEEDGRAFAALRDGWAERLRPQGPAETAALERFVAVIWREGRLVAVEDRLLRAMARGEPAEGLPALASILRYRARLERERRIAEEELARLRALRAAAAETVAAAGEAAAPVEPAGRAEPVGREAAGNGAATAGLRARVSGVESARGEVGHGWGARRDPDRSTDHLPVRAGGGGDERSTGPLGGDMGDSPSRDEAGPGAGSVGPAPGGSSARAGSERSATAPGAVRAVGAGRWGWRPDGAGAQADAAELVALLEGIEERLERERAKAEAEPWAAVVPEFLRALAEGGGAARARAA